MKCTVGGHSGGRDLIHALRIAYDGTRYAGWQRQENAPTVQQALEEALERLLGEKVAVVGAGRTDAGVHADGQVASFPLSRAFPASGLVHGTNHHLPAHVRIVAAAPAPERFHARRSAAAKVYRYRCLEARRVAPERAPFVLAVAAGLDWEAIERATLALPGRHDFSAFASAGGAPGPTERTLFAAGWRREGDERVLRVVGEGFLRGMVRALVGTLLEVGHGRRSVAEFAALLRGGGRDAAGATAPPHGLALERVDYPARDAPLW
ncbi:MAG: tRNA pseudouridine(38-40) synthase TruA [Acidobacteria bacterium]|nr:tRNA pseudouridine(38-40) synthase TruA [Acidobacteriota bacterium]MCB9377892.1 tRNA pseudouridine(38-40) synthase TruA [Holophagales bacterium]